MEKRPIPGYPGYFVTDDGQIVGRRGSVLKSKPNTKGYSVVGLYREGSDRPTFRKVHQLVASAWLPPRPSPEHELAHWDGTRTNSAPSNLRWATHQENMDDMARHGTLVRGEKCHNSKLNEEAVREIRRLTEKGLHLSSLAARFGVTRQAVHRVVQRKNWAHVQ